MKVVAIIQARTGSTRLPGKVLLPLADKTVLEHVVERTARAKLIDEVIVATTMKKEDLPIVKMVANMGFRVFTGSEKDVLDRYYQCARLAKADHIVRITSDCPFVDPYIIDEVINKHIRDEADVTKNTNCIHGFEVEVFTFNMLKKAWEEARLLSEREHVSPYMFKTATIIRKLSIPEDIPGVRLVLDYKEDYIVIKEVFEALYGKNKKFSYKDVLKFINTNKDILKVNANIERNEGLKISLQCDKLLSVQEIERLV